jgi:hypothetical protein
MPQPNRQCKIPHEKGFYLKEKIFGQTVKRRLQTNKSNKKFKEIQRLKLAIIVKLRNFAKISPITTSSILISSRFKLFLVERYKITNKFSKCSNIFNDFPLVNENHINHEEFVYFKIPSFELRIANQKTIKWNNRDLVTMCEKDDQHKLEFKFMREALVVRKSKENTVNKKEKQKPVKKNSNVEPSKSNECLSQNVPENQQTLNRENAGDEQSALIGEHLFCTKFP